MGFTCALSVTVQAVVSYTAFPPLLPGERYISVALSLESPPPDVIRHSALRSPDFPHLPYGSRDHLFYLISSFYPYAVVLYLEAAASDEFPANGIAGNIMAVNPLKIFQKLQKSFRFIEFSLFLRDAEQKRLCILFQYSQFIN